MPKPRLWLVWAGVVCWVLTILSPEEMVQWMKWLGVIFVLISNHRVAMGVLCFFGLEIALIGYINSHGQSKEALGQALIFGGGLLIILISWYRRPPRPPKDRYSE